MQTYKRGEYYVYLVYRYISTTGIIIPVSKNQCNGTRRCISLVQIIQFLWFWWNSAAFGFHEYLWSYWYCRLTKRAPDLRFLPTRKSTSSLICKQLTRRIRISRALISTAVGPFDINITPLQKIIRDSRDLQKLSAFESAEPHLDRWGSTMLSLGVLNVGQIWLLSLGVLNVGQFWLRVGFEGKFSIRVRVRG